MADYQKRSNHAPRREQKQQTTIDSDRVIRHLTRNFTNQTKDMGKAVKGTKLYDYQVEFAHMIHEIQCGYVYMMPKIIADANELIANIMIEREAESSKK